MEGRFAVPFHFAAEFLVLVVAVGACLDAVRARKYGAGVWSLAQAFAFALLAVAQALHGSLILQADAHGTIEAMRAAAFVILALAARPAASILPPVAMATAVVPALFFPGPHASLALIPCVAAVAVAARGVVSHRKDQDPATFAFAGAFVMFAAAEAAVAFAKTGGTLIIVSHVARALGALFLARWLWSSVVRSVRMRTVAAFVIVLTVGVLLVSGVLNLVIGDTLQKEDFKRLAEAGVARVGSISVLQDSALGAAAGLSLEGRLANNVARHAPPQAYFELSKLLPATANFLVVVDPKGKVLGSAENVVGQATHRLLRAEEASIAGTQVLSEVLSGRTSVASSVAISFEVPSGQELSEVVVLGAAAVRPTARTISAAIIVGYRLDLSFLRTVAQDTGLVRNRLTNPPEGGATLLVGEPLRVAAKTFTTLPADQALKAFSAGAAVARTSHAVATQLVTLGGLPYATAFIPVDDAQQRTVAILALSRRTTALAAAQRDITRTLFLVTLLAVAVAALLAWLSGGRVTRPIRSLTSAARELSTGNLEARARVASADEVGQLGSAFNDMAIELQRTTSGLRDAATAEMSLRARLEAIVQSMGDALIATDAESRIVTFNRAAEQMLGKRADRAVGRPIASILDGNAAGGRSLADVAMHAGSTQGVLRAANRSTLTVAMTSAPLLDDAGKPAGRVIVIRDVTREQEAERMKSEFLANVSHELRTPITPIKGYAEIMARKDFPRAKAMQFLEGILDSTERLERIVEILVDFAAIEAGRLKPKQEAVPVRSLIDTAIAKWRTKDTSHKFVRHGGADLAPALGDARLLGRALDELIDNAVKFTPSGGKIEVDAEAIGRGRGARKLAITVRDNGPGIEAERIPELFRDFRQLDGSETRAFGGLGLGLAYVKRIVNVHGGEVLVESEPGRGSAFTVILPIATGGTPAAKPQPTSTRVAPATQPAAARVAAKLRAKSAKAATAAKKRVRR